MTTPTPGTLLEALLSIQGQLPRITRDKAAVYGRYADLGQITDAVLPLLGAHGLVWTCLPTVLDSGLPVLRYDLRHSSGETLGGNYPLHGATPQALGASITYARRYALCSLLALVADEDTDGEPVGAQGRSGRRTRAAKTDTGMSDPQRRKMMALFAEAGYARGDRDGRLGYTNALLPEGRHVTTASDLTAAEADLVISTLEQGINEQRGHDR